MRILDYALLERIRCKKQTVIVLTGDPGEAKSSMAQALTEKLLALSNVTYAPFVNDVTVYTPFEFPDKEKNLLEKPELKKVNIMILDEARLVVKAKNWQDFLNKAISDIFALQRRVKQLLLIVVTQDLDDIDKDVRRLVTYWGECYRPLHGPAELYISRFYKDTRKPSKIELKKRKLRGIIEMPNGRTKKDYPSKFIFKMPSKEVWDTYDRENFKSKGAVIKKKLSEMLEKIKKDIGFEEKTRSQILLDYYLKPQTYQELMFHFRKTNRGNYKLKKGAAEILGIPKQEIKSFELNAKEGFKKVQGDLNGISESKQDN